MVPTALLMGKERPSIPIWTVAAESLLYYMEKQPTEVLEEFSSQVCEVQLAE
jgi:hypothetical protein